MKNTTSFIIDNLISEGFFDPKSIEYTLTEEEEDGKSELIWNCKNETNICISSFDKKKTEILFFKIDKILHLYKRVDHVVFELNQNQTWDVHLIEMKTGVESAERWVEIKGKFRSSYLIVKAIAGILDLEIENCFFYTSYEHASLMKKEYNTVTRKLPLGKKHVKLEDEWNGIDFGLNIGDRLKFKHTPIKMTRNRDGILIQKIEQ